MSIMISLAEAAKRIGIPERTLRDLAGRGEFPARKVGKRWRITIDALERWMNAGEKQAPRSVISLSEARR